MKRKGGGYNGYRPPFTLSARAVGMIADISAQMERFAMRMEQSDALTLRKANRIKTIYSSLAIEGNTLLESEVADIIDGKTVVAPIREIQEVKNAIRVYEEFDKLDPFSMDDLLKAHGLMMSALTDEAGSFRRGNVGVYSERGLVHMAPPAHRVHPLMCDLFGWLKHADDHLLVRSCVFHYEFEFIHPFIDGNGRTGRLWQSLILGKLHPLFEHLPVENMVYSNQQQYYDSITASSKAGHSGPFIDFMLNEIYKTLKSHQGAPLQEKVPNKVPNKVPDKLKKEFLNISDATWDVYMVLKSNHSASSEEIGAALGISSRMVRKHIAYLREAGIIVRVGSNKTGYWKVNI